MNPETKPRIFTVGHGNAPFQEIERILRLHGVATLVDVRSAPYSKYAPDFRKSALAEYAAAAGLGYRWMGDRLGGREAESGQMSADGEVDPRPEVDPASFVGALAEVVALNETGPVVLLCAERDPDHCHRSIILAPQLEILGCEVFHILPDATAHRHQPSLGI
ncbi:MAG: DUF488 domain-containing protein [Acidimicrobiia bacterium]|nr:DUF488 domain-containing protein [Acidimicrobiia bacterium]